MTHKKWQASVWRENRGGKGNDRLKEDVSKTQTDVESPCVTREELREAARDRPLAGCLVLFSPATNRLDQVSALDLVL